MPKKKEITQDQIAERAYDIWQREGQPHGHDQDHWAQAEAELRDTTAPKKAAKPKSTAKTAVKAEPAVSASKAKLNGTGAHLGA